MDIRACHLCGDLFPIGSRERNPRKWCSRSCAAKASRARRPKGEPPSPVMASRTCVGCGVLFEHRQTHPRQWCTNRCAAIQRQKVNRTPCIDCGAASYGERCSTCFKLSQGWSPDRPVREKRRRAALRRLARERSAPGLDRNGRVALLAKWKRRGRTCYYCPSPADTVDHVVPLSRGGTNLEGNLVPCCNDCNWKKNDNLLIRWRTGIGAKMWHLRYTPKVDCTPRPKMQRPRTPKPTVLTIGQCRICSAPFVSSMRNAALCGDECRMEANARAVRDRWRARHGKPVDPSEPTSKFGHRIAA